jgi:hypothetical protein
MDILQHIDGVSFDQAWENRIQGLVDGEVPFTWDGLKE